MELYLDTVLCPTLLVCQFPQSDSPKFAYTESLVGTGGGCMFPAGNPPHVLAGNTGGALGRMGEHTPPPPLPPPLGLSAGLGGLRWGPLPVEDAVVRGQYELGGTEELVVATPLMQVLPVGGGFRV